MNFFEKPTMKACFYTIQFFKIAFIRWAFIKSEQNYIAKLDSMITHILMSQFKTFDSKQKKIESTDRRKTSFPKEIVENPDLDKSVLSK